MNNKSHIGINSNQTIRDAIQKISRHGLINPLTGAVRGTERFTGFVKKIHTTGELAGTVDVQEYSTLAMSDDDGKIGYHEGVYLSSVQDSSNGYVIIPKLYSEVTVATDPDTLKEYVVMTSHVDLIQLDSHDMITIGVREREEYDDDEDGKTVEELDTTGVFTHTEYKKDSITTSVQGEEAGNHTQQILDSTKAQVVIGDDKTSVLADQSQIHLKHGDTETLMNDSQHTSKCGDAEITIKDGVVYLGDTGDVDAAVLGKELATVLSDLIMTISQIMTPTMMGPQPPANMAKFVQMKAQVDQCKARCSGFLTEKVKVRR